MVLGRKIEWSLQQRVAEMPLLEVEPDLHPGRAQPIAVGVVHVEHQVERAARQPESCDVDLFQLDVGLTEREAADGGTATHHHHPHGKRETGNGKHTPHHVSPFPLPVSRTTRSFNVFQNSIRSLTVFSYPDSVGSYQLAPRNASGRYSCGA